MQGLSNGILNFRLPKYVFWQSKMCIFTIKMLFFGNQKMRFCLKVFVTDSHLPIVFLYISACSYFTGNLIQITDTSGYQTHSCLLVSYIGNSTHSIKRFFHPQKADLFFISP